MKLTTTQTATLAAIKAAAGRCVIDGPVVGGTYVRRFSMRTLRALVNKGLVHNPSRTAAGWLAV